MTAAFAPTRPSLPRDAREIAALPHDADMTPIEELTWFEVKLNDLRAAQTAHPENVPAVARAVESWHHTGTVTP